MGFFKIKRALAVGGGSVQLGADVNFYRSAANMGKTDDGLTIGGTPAVLPYGTAAPTLDVNGDFRVWHKAGTTHRAALVFYSNGTAYQMQFPSTTNGTVTITVGAPS